MTGTSNRIIGGMVPIAKRTMLISLAIMVFTCLIGCADGRELKTYSEYYTVGAYYYPYPFDNGVGILRDELKQQPELGMNYEMTGATVSKHLEYSRQANVNLWVTSWPGKESKEDDALINIILPHTELQSHQIALLYETEALLAEQEDKDVITRKLLDDIGHVANHYFAHPNYFTIADRPLIVIRDTRKLYLRGLLRQVVLFMRSEAAKHGKNVYIVGDNALFNAPGDEANTLFEPFFLLDAITQINFFSAVQASSRFVGTGALERHFERQQQWKDAALKHNCHFIPGIAPGFNDLASKPPESNRQLEEGDDETPDIENLNHDFSYKSSWSTAHLSSDSLQRAQPLSQEEIEIDDSATSSTDPPVQARSGTSRWSGHTVLSRQETRNAAEGTLLEVVLRQAMADSMPETHNLILVNSFNDWKIDTQIEPVVGEDTNQPQRFSQNLLYRAYGNQYLNLLYQATYRTAFPTTSPSTGPSQSKPPTPAPTLAPTVEAAPTHQPTEAPVPPLPTLPPAVYPERPPLEEDVTFADHDGALVGVYYYPWHAGDFHRNAGYLRDDIGQEPELGEYDDRDPSVIAQHLAWSRQANVKVWMCSWWGKSTLSGWCFTQANCEQLAFY